MSQAVNLAEKLASFEDHWAPRTIATVNDYDVMVVKVRGEFGWHSHPETDEMFLVLKGTLTIRMRADFVTLGRGEIFVVPKGVEHQPYAEEEAHIMLLEPTGTPNTGDKATAQPRRTI